MPRWPRELARDRRFERPHDVDLVQPDAELAARRVVESEVVGEIIAYREGEQISPAVYGTATRRSA